MKRLALIFALFSTQAFAAPTTSCNFVWAGEQPVQIDFTGLSGKKVRATLLVTTDGETHTADLGAAVVKQDAATKVVGVGFFMGGLMFNFPRAALKAAGKDFAVTVDGNIEGDKGSFQATCRSSR